MPEVLSVKRKLLRRMGAEVPTEAANGAASSSSSASQPAPQHALRAASYATAAGDLADGTWVEGLKAAGRCISARQQLHAFGERAPSLAGVLVHS